MDTIAEVVRATLEPEAFSLYLLRGDALELVLHEGWPAGAAWPRQYVPIPRCSTRWSRPPPAVRGARTDEEILGEQGLLAGPLVDMRSGTWSGC